MAKRNLCLLIIDPQNDFCDLPPSHCPSDPMAGNGKRLAPALPVPGAHEDLLRLASLINHSGSGLTAITVTLDTHQRLDIAHPGFWMKGDGSPISPFTRISADMVRKGEITPRQPDARERAQSYLEQLEAAERYAHMVWPVHCEIGTWGHNVHPALHASCQAWEEQAARNVTYVSKGMNPWTEHFSAIQAEVPDPLDPSTQVNAALLESLRRADTVFIAGEAGSHCVKSTTEHLADHFAQSDRSKLVLIEDAMSPVQGFETQQKDFIEAMRTRGLRVARIAEVLQELQENAE